jgi:vacuolar-type H+-ATPase subunit E/Vma4
MAQDGLIRFSEAIISEAEEKKRKFVSCMEEENKMLLDKKRKQLYKKYETEIRYKCDKLSQELSAGISKKQNEAKLELFNLRQKMFEETFCTVVDKLNAYVKTDDYKEYLKNFFNNVVDKLWADDIECYALPDDIEFLKDINFLKQVTFIESDKTIIGGFVIKSEIQRALYDCTFKDKLEREKNLFLKSSGLVIE